MAELRRKELKRECGNVKQAEELRFYLRVRLVGAELSWQLSTLVSSPFIGDAAATIPTSMVVHPRRRQPDSSFWGEKGESAKAHRFSASTVLGSIRSRNLEADLLVAVVLESAMGSRTTHDKAGWLTNFGLQP